MDPFIILLLFCIVVVLSMTKTILISMKVSINSLQEKIPSNAEIATEIKETNNELHNITALLTPAIKAKSLELSAFNNMESFMHFLRPNDDITPIDIFNKFYLINPRNEIESYKIYFLQEISKLIFSNNLHFKDLKIIEETMGLFPDENYIEFEVIDNRYDFDGGEIELFDIVFTLTNNSKKNLTLSDYMPAGKYSFSSILNVWYKQFKTVYDVEYGGEYDEKRSKNIYRVMFNDLKEYITFLGEHYFNKDFSFDSSHGTFSLTSAPKDCTWHPDKIFHSTSAKKRHKTNENSEKPSNELVFNQLLDLYKINIWTTNSAHTKTIKSIHNCLDNLIKNDYPLAYVVKALLHLDGRILLKDYEEAKRCLIKAYNLELYGPALLVWNKNKLEKIAF